MMMMMMMMMMMKAVCVVVCVFPVRGVCFSRGASVSSCVNMKPGHISSFPQHTHTHSTVSVRSGRSVYLPRHTLTVTVQSSRAFMGFLLQARSVVEDRVVGGEFTLHPPGTHTLSCLGTDDTVTHSAKMLKRNLSFSWRAPAQPSGDLRFYITLVQSYFVYWSRIRSAVVHDGTRSSPITDSITGQPMVNTTVSLLEKTVKHTSLSTHANTHANTNSTFTTYIDTHSTHNTHASTHKVTYTHADTHAPHDTRTDTHSTHSTQIIAFIHTNTRSTHNTPTPSKHADSHTNTLSMHNTHMIASTHSDTHAPHNTHSTHNTNTIPTFNTHTNAQSLNTPHNPDINTHSTHNTHTNMHLTSSIASFNTQSSSVTQTPLSSSTQTVPDTPSSQSVSTHNTNTPTPDNTHTVPNPLLQTRASLQMTTHTSPPPAHTHKTQFFTASIHPGPSPAPRQALSDFLTTDGAVSLTQRKKHPFGDVLNHPKQAKDPSGVPEGGIERPERAPRQSAFELGLLLGLSAALGMAIAAGLRYLQRKHCRKHTAVSLNDCNHNDRGILHVQECGDLVQVRKIRQNSFLVLQAEYNLITPTGN
ncbi:reelin domain-containing protein 1-like [Puntigrus tetrazona]|uniref:reelin domain-containing protein 1-like n=1 Tax=Puntigrus tetrazona TaxID=1606681 RepID=UPI001C8938E3|nr:reelin domain-containing protein 1-like [Puntigrus tetrazona]XP_043086244.1 reelin domain-containing protein 1-like [Puntigrus tetrazona]